MQTLRTQLTKYRNFVSTSRHLKEQPFKQGVNFMQTENQIGNSSRSTGGYNANKRYKRTSEELDQDIARVDELVASGKYNQIEALNEVGLQSSVYHYRKRQAKEPVAKSRKPRKFAPRPNRRKQVDNSYQLEKEQLIKQLKQARQDKVQNLELDKLRNELEEFKIKCAKLQEYIVENVVLKQ